MFCVVVNGAQTETVVFGPSRCAARMAENAVLVSMPTIAPQQARDLAARLGQIGVDYLDAPIRGGAAKAAEGRLSVMAPGAPGGVRADRRRARRGFGEPVRLGDQPGHGSTFKIVNQLLAGVHIAAASEATAFAAAQGLDLEEVYRIITLSAGNSAGMRSGRRTRGAQT